MTAEPLPGDETSATELPAMSLRPVETTKSPPRLWTVFVVYLAALGGSILVQVIAVIVLIIWHVAHGADIQQLAQDLPAIVTTPLVFIAFGLLAQLVIGLAAIIPAKLSREPTHLRLGFAKPSLPLWAYLIVVIGAWFPCAIGLGLAYLLALAIEPDPSVRRIYENMTLEAAVPFVLFIALAPGFTEEMLFRGYMQRRLLKRWSAWLAIPTIAVLFAIMHLAPHAVVFAFPIGLWLGVVAWRTGSIWPGIVCHAFINGSWNILQIGQHFGVFPERLPIAILAVMGAVVCGCFVGSLWVIARSRVGIDFSGVKTPEKTAGE